MIDRRSVGVLTDRYFFRKTTLQRFPEPGSSEVDEIEDDPVLIRIAEEYEVQNFGFRLLLSTNRFRPSSSPPRRALRVLKKESQHLARCVRPVGIGVRARSAAA